MNKNYNHRILFTGHGVKTNTVYLSTNQAIGLTHYLLSFLSENSGLQTAKQRLLGAHEMELLPASQGTQKRR